MSGKRELEGLEHNRSLPLEGHTLPTGYWTFDMVQERLIEAFDFMRRMPDREARWLRVSTMSLWDRVSITADMTQVERAEYLLYRAGDAPRMPPLNRNQVDRMEEAMAWLLWVKPETRRIMGIAVQQLANGHSRVDWVKTGADPRVSGSTDRMRVAYQRAITSIAKRLSGNVMA